MAEFTRVPFTRADYGELVTRLEAMAEEGYRAFNARIVPDTAAPMLGVRAPALKALAKQIANGDWNGYLLRRKARGITKKSCSTDWCWGF